MTSIEGIHFCPHTLEFFKGLQSTIKKIIYPFQSVYCSVNKSVFTVSHRCQNLVVKDHNSQATCFQRYPPPKKKKKAI